MSGSALPINGARRREVAEGLWASWQKQGRGAAVLTGFSGIGKSEQVVRPLVDRAAAEGRVAVRVDLPLHPVDLDSEVKGAVSDELRLSGENDLADAVDGVPTLAVALSVLLRGGGLVVLDEFQRALDPDGRPVEPLSEKLLKLAERRADGGALWLVSNREVDPAWTESFHEARLEAPDDEQDQMQVVIDAIGTVAAEDRFPTDRRVEVVRRLGGNPRALRLLGNILRRYTLEEVLGPALEAPTPPADPRFTEGVERTLLAKAEEGLSREEGRFLRDLAVLRGPASESLVRAVGGLSGDDMRAVAQPLRDRYLIDVDTRADRYTLHPLIREVEVPREGGDPAAWRSAHRRAGVWYAGPLYDADQGRLGDADLALRLSGARYHLVEAEATDVLQEAMRGISSYIERRYSQDAPNPLSAEDRDAQIALLRLYLAESKTGSVNFTYAKLLKQRGALGDPETALPHAVLATEDEEHAHPWVLWVQLVREVEGLEAAVVAARTAAEHVLPAKGLHSVYQLLGGYLIGLVRAGEAVNAQLKGAEQGVTQPERLIESALLMSAAEPSTVLLQQVRDWTSGRQGLTPTFSLSKVLLLEHAGRWQDAAEAAQKARDDAPAYLFLALHEALCWLGVKEAEKALEALGRFSLRREPGRREGVTWLVALVALHSGRVAEASDFLAKYLGTPAPTTAAGVRAKLLEEWDTHVGMTGEPNSAYAFPILPASVTGLATDVRRPQYGSPVLPQHQDQPAEDRTPEVRSAVGLKLLVVATEWTSGQGGLSTFNRRLCLALAAAGVRVVCLVEQATPAEKADAEASGVKVIEATAAPGMTPHAALSRRPEIPDDFVPDLIIGHGRVTGPAAQALAEDDFEDAQRVHLIHVAPDEIEWYKTGRDDDAGERADDRTQTEIDLGRTAACVVAVGPRLYNRYLRDLSAYDGVPAPVRFDPGFDAPDAAPRRPPPGDPISILVLGRVEDEQIKGLDIAARAVGLAAARRQQGMLRLELKVRGARPETSAALQAQLLGWSGLPSLEVVVRPYTTDPRVLATDLRQASLVMMPSRSEGFGLVGLEAIVAGVPVLVSGNSGLGELLVEALGVEPARQFVVPISGVFERDADEWSRGIESALRNLRGAFTEAGVLQSRLSEERTWDGAVAKLLRDLSGLFPPGS